MFGGELEAVDTGFSLIVNISAMDEMALLLV